MRCARGPVALLCLDNHFAIFAGDKGLDGDLGAQVALYQACEFVRGGAAILDALGVNALHNKEGV